MRSSEGGVESVAVGAWKGEDRKGGQSGGREVRRMSCGVLGGLRTVDGVDFGLAYKGSTSSGW